MTKANDLHLRKVRPKRRTGPSPETGDQIPEVFTLCGQWVTKPRAIREDKSLTRGNVCDECSAKRDLGRIFGDEEE